jgi:hypothetical protein
MNCWSSRVIAPQAFAFSHDARRLWWSGYSAAFTAVTVPSGCEQ